MSRLAHTYLGLAVSLLGPEFDACPSVESCEDFSSKSNPMITFNSVSTGVLYYVAKDRDKLGQASILRPNDDAAWPSYIWANRRDSDDLVVTLLSPVVLAAHMLLSDSRHDVALLKLFVVFKLLCARMERPRP
jgi:hypothetical protein